MLDGEAATSALGAQVAVSVLIVGEAAALFAGFCPSWFTVSSDFFHAQGSRAGNIKRIRQGETAATAVTMLIAAGSSYLIKSPLPLIAGAATSAVMIAGYEYSIRNPASSEALPAMSSLQRALAWRGPALAPAA